MIDGFIKYEATKVCTNHNLLQIISSKNDVNCHDFTEFNGMFRRLVKDIIRLMHQPINASCIR